MIGYEDGFVYFFGASSTWMARASVYVMSTISPTFTPFRFFGSLTLTVSLFPLGPIKVTFGTLVSIAVIVTVTVVCCATAPAGFSPGLAAAAAVVVCTPAVPCFLTSYAIASV